MQRFASFFLSVFLLSTCQSFARNLEYENSCKEWVLCFQPSIPGWCSKTKCVAMMDLIFKVRPDVCVEIGVYGGASLFPTAIALKYLNQGIVYGIDPWDVRECIKYYPEGSPHKGWWGTIDMNAMYQSTMNLIKTHELEKKCLILRMTSEEAAPCIQEIDVLHVDGNHCDEADLIHLSYYLPKVKVGGYIWFDGWCTSPKAYEYVKKTCYIRKVLDSGNCILLEKICSE